MTLLEKINNLTWWDEPNKLKTILKNLLGLNETLISNTEVLASDLAAIDVRVEDLENAGSGASYLVYTALVNQGGTSAPVLTVLENTLGITLTPTRNVAGQYTFTASSSMLDLNKTTIDVGQVKFSSVAAGKAAYTIEHASTSFFIVYTHQAPTSTWSQTDNNFRNNILEIRLYP